MDVFLLCLSTAALAGAAAFMSATPQLEASARRGLFHAAQALEGTDGARRLGEHALWRDAERYLAERFQLSAPGGFMLLMGMLSVPLGMLLSRSLLGGLILPAALGASAAGLALRYRRERRDATEQEIPEVFRTLALGLEAGQTLRQAMEYVGVTHAGPVGRSFAEATLEMQAGASVAEALGSVEREVKGPGMALMVSALEIAQRTGSPLKELFAASASYVEQQGELRRELSAKTAQVRLSVQVVCTLPVAIVSLLAFISPDFRAGMATEAGMLSLLLAGALDAVAILIIRRLAEGVL